MTIGKGYFLVMLNNYLIERIKGASLLAVGRFLFSVGSGAETLGMFVLCVTDWFCFQKKRSFFLKRS